MEAHLPQFPSAFQTDLSEASSSSGDVGLQRMAKRLTTKLSQDALVQQVTSQLRRDLDVDRIALYHFYRQWEGQVTFEALRDESLSILGMTGASECFNQDYAQMYLEGRVKASPDIQKEDIHDCHREFLESIQVKANLVVPILTSQGLWGLFAAHHTAPRNWSPADIEAMQAGAQQLATAPSIAKGV